MEISNVIHLIFEMKMIAGIYCMRPEQPLKKQKKGKSNEMQDVSALYETKLSNF